MKNDILEKISKSLSSNKVGTEEKIVYIFVEIGKLLELLDKPEEYQTIQFYRNWVSHSYLCKGMAQKILRSIKYDRTQKTETEIMGFIRLHHELEKFLKMYKLPTNITNNGWFQFRRGLISIISDQPLINKFAEPTGIKEITLVRMPKEIEDMLIGYDITLGNGEKIRTHIGLGDQDEKAKQKLKLTTLMFDYRFCKKRWRFLRGALPSLKGDERIKMEKRADIEFNNMKIYQKEIDLLQSEVFSSELADSL